MIKLRTLSIALAMVAACSSTEPNFDLPNTGPSTCAYQVQAHAVTPWELKQPVVRFIFWGDFWQKNSESQVEIQQWEALLNTSNVLDRLSEYGIQAGVLDTNEFDDTLPMGNPIDDSKIAPKLETGFQLGWLPVPDANSLYVVFLPPGVTTQSMVKNKWTGYHSASSYGPVPYAFAVINHADPTPMNVTLSHEIYEAATNPDTTTGYYDNKRGEVGDICQGADDIFDGYEVQKVWSQAACRCE